MSKRQLVDRISSGSGLTVKQSEKALSGLMDVVHSELSPGGDVSLIGLGVFSVVDQRARTIRSPKTGEEMEVKTRKIPVFKMGSTLKRAVDSGQQDGSRTSGARASFDQRAGGTFDEDSDYRGQSWRNRSN